MKKIFISSDHAGYNLKEQIKKKFKRKYFFEDLGTNDSNISVNYPDYAHKLCRKVSNNSKNMGILVCGSGMGMSMAANKHKKIRAAVCYSIKNTKLSRLHIPIITNPGSISWQNICQLMDQFGLPITLNIIMRLMVVKKIEYIWLHVF